MLEVSCPGCAGEFRVPDTAAGKKIRCPKCKGAIDVPAAVANLTPELPAVEASRRTTPTHKPTPVLPTPSKPKPQSTAEQWFLKTGEEEEYGPVTASELDQWKGEGRITNECQLLRAGDEQWQWAADVFPDLANEDEPVPQRPAAKSTPAKQPARAVPKQSADPPRDELPPSSRSRLVAGLLGIFLGPLGTHRFYLGYWVIGLLMLATGGGCGIWSLVDAVLVFLKKVPDADGRRLSD